MRRLKGVNFRAAGHAVTQGLNTWLMPKSPGTWFFWSNSGLNGQTHPALAALYMCVYAGQRVATRFCADATNNRFTQFVLGQQGVLLANAVTTAVAGAATVAIGGSWELAKACGEFALANSGQAAITDNYVAFPNTMRGKIAKNISLGVCQLSILDGLRHIAEYAGYSPQQSWGLVLPGVILGGYRLFQNQLDPLIRKGISGWDVHPDWIHADMMGITAAIGYSAYESHQPLIALSRALTVVAFSRLAVVITNNLRKGRPDLRRSICEVEYQLPRLAGWGARKLGRNSSPAA